MKTLLKTLLLLLILGNVTSALAAKYKPITEIPGQVPETDEEKAVWEVGRAHIIEARKNGEAINAPQLELYLEGIVRRLMGDMVEKIGLDVDVLVFKDPTVNAWVYPDGTVAVQTGLLAAMQNEAQLAAIIGHEISHFLNRHAFIQIKSKQKQSMIGKGLGALTTAVVAAKTGAVDTSLMKTGQIWTGLVTSGYSRKLETAADEQGLDLLVKSGYPADQALIAFEQLRIKDDDQVNISKMWSSHPDIDSRLKNLSKQIKKLDQASSGQTLSKSDYLSTVSKAVLINSQLLVNRRQFDLAISSLKGYLAEQNDDAQGHFLLAEAYRKQTPEDNYQARDAAYLKALSIDTGLSVAYKELGMSYRQQGQKSQAIAEFERYLAAQSAASDGPIIRWYIDDLNGS